jgi:hypothetical protein
MEKSRHKTGKDISSGSAGVVNYGSAKNAHHETGAPSDPTLNNKSPKSKFHASYNTNVIFKCINHLFLEEHIWLNC